MKRSVAASAPCMIANGELVTSCDLPLDGAQILAAQKLQQFLLPKSKRLRHTQGIYLWGNPGSGKTVLLDAVYRLMSGPKRRLHYYEFLRQRLWLAAAEDVVGAGGLLCFDEFHIHDPATATMLQRFFETLLRQPRRILVTSNYAPDALLAESAYRTRAAPLIALIKSHLQTHHLQGEHDYRQLNNNPLEHYCAAVGSSADLRLTQLLTALGESALEPAGRMILHGQEWLFKGQTRHAIWLDFSVLCQQMRSALDYLQLARSYPVVAIGNVTREGLSEANSLRRFVWLIDVLYEQHCLLLLTAEGDIFSLLHDFSDCLDLPRTISRLQQLRDRHFVAAALARRVRH